MQVLTILFLAHRLNSWLKIENKQNALLTASKCNMSVLKKFSSPKISRRLVDRASTCAAGHHCASIGQGEVRRRAVLERCSLLRG